MTKINPRDFDFAVNRLRDFCRGKGMVEVHTQSNLSILAACEDPTTIGKFTYAGEDWPLPQTGQIDLEEVLLQDPSLPGVFCVSTSFRQELNPVPGRHDLIFPMFEFELPGGVRILEDFERELLESLGFGEASSFPGKSYGETTSLFQEEFVTDEVEAKIGDHFGPVFFLDRFPNKTSPFWNMRRDGDIARKIDVIIHSIETIGSAERSCDPEEMCHLFNTISNGEYAELLFSHFGRKRVLRELDAFLSHDFFPRFGGGIGMTRMIRAMKLSGLIEDTSGTEETRKETDQPREEVLQPTS